MTDEAKHYDRDTLFDFMNGAADLYFTYGFEGLSVGEYTDRDGRVIQIEIYDTATDADAYGLFTYNSYGEPIELGVDGELDSGYRLAFWQGPHYVHIAPREEVQNAILRDFGQAVASALPQAGQRPFLVDALPREGLTPGSMRFFREKMALDNLLWLGSDDVMGLGADTQGVVARYEVGGQGLDLLLVAFPDAERAEQARLGLEGAELDLIALETGDNVLGAAIGQADAEVGRAWVAQAIVQALAATD
jgi:hypothetical protein